MSGYYCSKCHAPAAFDKESGVQRSCDCNVSVIADMGSVKIVGTSKFNHRPVDSFLEDIKICLIGLIQRVKRGDQ